jgi:hypothetical protein
MQAKAREKKGRLGMLGMLGLCVCQTKNPMQRWVQQLVENNFSILLLNMRVSFD